MPRPTQMADIRKRSVSKQAQQSLPRFNMIPRGVRLSAAQSPPGFRVSRAEEKKGKFVSTKSAQIGCVGAGSVEGAAAKDTMADASQPTAKIQNGGCLVET